MADYTDFVYDNTDETWVEVSGMDASDSLSNADANPIVLDISEAKGSAKGTVGFDTDYKDYYSFTALEDGFVVITLTGLDEAAYTRLYRSDGEEIGHTLSSNTDDKIMTYSLDKDEAYVVLVDAYGTSATAYELLIDGTSVEEGMPVPIPSSFTDTINGAPLSVDDASDTILNADYAALNPYGVAVIRGTTGYNDQDGYDNQDDKQDVYKFELEQSGEVEFLLSDLTDELFIRLYEGEEELATSLVPGKEDKTINISLQENSVYTIVVDPYYAAKSPYTLTIDGPPEGGSVTFDDIVDGRLVPGDNDANDSRADATDILASQLSDARVQITGSVGFDADTQDWYSFELEEAQQATISLSGFDEDLELSLHGDLIGELSSSSGSISETLDPGVYSVGVTPSGDAESNYALDISFSEAVVQKVDTFNAQPVGTRDAGGTFANSAPVEFDNEGRIDINGWAGSIDGQTIVNDLADWYKFTVPVNGEYRFDFQTSGVFNSIELYDEEGQLVPFEESTSPLLSPLLDAEKTYSVMVEPNFFGQRQLAEYSLLITASDLAGPGSADRLGTQSIGDASNQSAEPTEFQISSGENSIQGWVGASNDPVDYYLLSLPETAGSLSVDYPAFVGSLAVELDGDWVTLTPDQYTIEFPAAKEYKLRFDTAGDVEKEYALDLNVTFPPPPPQDKVDGESVEGGDATAGAPGLVNLNAAGASITGSVGGADASDDYMVTLPQNQGKGLLDLSDFAGNLSVEVGGSLFELPHQPFEFNLDGKDYRLVVTTADDDVTEYRLQLNVDLLHGETSDGNDAANTLQSATAVAFDDENQATISGATGYGDDVGDCYQFTVSDDMKITLSTDDQVLNAILFDADQEFIGFQHVGSEEVALSITDPGNYYLAVEPFLGSQSPYQLGFDMA